MRNKLFFFMFLSLIVFPLFTQESRQAAQIINAEEPALDVSQRMMLARSSIDYRVTPGDMYTLSYSIGATPVSYAITVDTSYRIRVSNLGVVNGTGKTFIQVKNEVENIVTNNYPLSGVQLVLTQPAYFQVYINGEVQVAGESQAWALSRLSSLTLSNLTRYTSIRNITIKSTNGQERSYDLFRAQRFGEMDQDPYLRPGDVVTFNRRDRIVAINGAVERPGSYEILSGENINELIHFYGNGYTATADDTRIELVRIVNSNDIAGNKIFITEEDLKNNYILEDNDEITVPVITQLQPVMFLEGALKIESDTELTASNRIIVRFYSGENYSTLARRHSVSFSETSDTQNAYIIRDNIRIPIDLNKSLYDASYREDILVEDSDVLVIPFRQYFVSVAGAVHAPGRYPYIPDRDWEYYIGLAGGFIPNRNSRNSISIVDINGNKMKKTDIIVPETTITANTNHFLYFFNSYGPVISSILSIITSFFTVMAVTGAL